MRTKVASFGSVLTRKVLAASILNGTTNLQLQCLPAPLLRLEARLHRMLHLGRLEGGTMPAIKYDPRSFASSCANAYPVWSRRALG